MQFLNELPSRLSIGPDGRPVHRLEFVANQPCVPVKECDIIGDPAFAAAFRRSVSASSDVSDAAKRLQEAIDEIAENKKRVVELHKRQQDIEEKAATAAPAQMQDLNKLKQEIVKQIGMAENKAHVLAKSRGTADHGYRATVNKVGRQVVSELVEAAQHRLADLYTTLANAAREPLEEIAKAADRHHVLAKLTMGPSLATRSEFVATVDMLCRELHLT